MIRHPSLVSRPRELFQLAGEWRGGVPEGGTWIEEKHDGARAGWIAGRLLTREGIAIGGIGHIAWHLAAIEREAGEPMFFDAEFIAPGGFLATLEHIGRGERAAEGGTLHLFDCMPLMEWKHGGTDRPLIQRKAMLRDLVAAAPDPALSWDWRPGTHGAEPEGPAIAVVEDHWCADQSEVEDMAVRIWARGGEGVMLKDAESPYRRNRNGAWRKFKRHDWAVQTKAQRAIGRMRT